MTHCSPISFDNRLSERKLPLGSDSPCVGSQNSASVRRAGRPAATVAGAGAGAAACGGAGAGATAGAGAGGAADVLCAHELNETASAATAASAASTRFNELGTE